MKQLIYPPFLVKGDEIIIISPSSKIEKSYLTGAEKRLSSWGLKVTIGNHAASTYASYAGTMKQRLSDLQKALDDPNIKAIFCSRGGYGAVHLVDKLNFDKFKQNPKWLIGFSDITALHNRLQAEGYASLHAPMAKHLSEENQDDIATLYLKNSLFGNLPTYRIVKNKYNRSGIAKGILRGGNLAVLYGLRATPYDIPPKGTILFIEDIGERPHAIERMLYNLKLSGFFDNISGLIIGQFTEFEDNKALGKELKGLISDVLKDYSFPVCFNFPVGHVTKNLPLINGSKVELKVSNKNVELKFI